MEQPLGGGDRGVQVFRQLLDASGILSLRALFPQPTIELGPKDDHPVTLDAPKGVDVRPDARPKRVLAQGRGAGLLPDRSAPPSPGSFGDPRLAPRRRTAPRPSVAWHGAPTLRNGCRWVARGVALASLQARTCPGSPALGACGPTTPSDLGFPNDRVSLELNR